MFKKLIAVLLCLCALCGFGAFTGVASAANPPRLDKYETLDIFKSLGMIGDDYDNVTIEWNKPVTKAEFAFFAANVLKRGKTSEQLYYHDISKQHWAASSIAVLVEHGLLEVNQEKLFYPDAVVSADDASGVIVQALGYRFDIGDADGPINIADRIGITKGVSHRDELTFNDVFTMLYNALITEVMEIDSVSGGKFTYKNIGNIYLETEYSISYKKGVLEGYDGISSVGMSVGRDMVRISGMEYEIGNVDIADIADMVGCTVLYLYDYSDDKYAGRLIWISKRDNDELTLYYAENEVSFDPLTYKLSYYDTTSNRDKKISISKTVDVLYNDEYVVSGLEELLNGDMYSIKLIKSSNESEYSKIILSGYRNIVVGAIDTYNEGVYDKISKTFLPLGSISRLEIVDKEKQSTDLSGLKLGDVLSVYESKSGSIVRILVSDSEVSGQITNKRTENDYEYITVNGTEYRGAGKRSYWDSQMNRFVKLYLDVNGHIAYVERSTQYGNLAFLIKAYHEDWEERLTLRLFNTDGQIVKYECTESLKIDDKKFNNAKAALNALGGSSFASTLIMYKTNAEGLVTQIYLPGRSDGSNLKVLQDKVSGTYRDTGRIGRKSFINNDTLIFAIPKNPKVADERDFEILSKNGLVGDTGYTYSTYTTGEDVGYEEIMVLHNYEHKESGSNGMLITKIYECVNEDDEVVYCLEGYTGSNIVSVKCAPECSLANVYVGNYITYELKKNKSISSINVRCDYLHDIKPIQTNLHQTTAFSSGYVNDVIDEIVRIGDYSGADFDAAYKFESRVPVIVYDTDTKKARIGSIADLKTYKTTGDDCSFVFTHVKGGVSSVFVVYE